MALITDEQLKGIMKRYEERLFAGPSGAAAKKEEEPQEEKRWGWSYKEPELEQPKRKLTFREWLDGGMKGECQ